MADQGSEGVLSSWLRKKRIKAVSRFLKNRVFDFGCGSGALAKLVNAELYLGMDVDNVSLQKARVSFPDHSFTSEYPNASRKFDTIVALAVIEHISNPAQILQTMASYLENDPGSRLVVTTPHPSFLWVHELGARLGLFSKHASEEHEELLNYNKLEVVGNQAGLKLDYYRRFLFGANQIAVYKKQATSDEVFSPANSLKD